MYSIAGYGKMIADRVRMGAYTEALRRAIRPGSVVLDIGTGTGIFSILACQMGARKVYAIEPSDSIQVAREIACANGYAGRIEFIQDFSTRITLPELADVLVSDLHGVLPLFQQIVPSIADARKRLLSPECTLVPLRDHLWAAVVESPDFYDQYLAPWDTNGIDMSAARRIVTNAWCKIYLKPEHLIVEPRRWAEMDYAVMEDPNMSADIVWTVERERTGNGLALWFDSTLADDIEFSSAPGAPRMIYGQAFFPWSSQVALEAGDTVSVKLQAKLTGDDYTWVWETQVLGSGLEENVKAEFKQSTLFGVPLSIERLRKRADKYVPRLSEDGLIEHFILSEMNGETPVGEIARKLMSAHPEKFADWHDALTRVGEVSSKYSR